MDDIIKLADKIAQEAHEGQFDKAGKPYIEHPRFVAACVSGKYEKAAALLHDVIEDSDFMLEDLRRRGIPDEVLSAVELLTKKKSESYEEYILQIKENPIARAVKIADLKHNSDISRIAEPSPKDFARVEKYHRSIALLE